MKKLLLLLSLLFPCLLFAQVEPDNYKQAIKQFKYLYNKGDAVGFFSMFNSTLKTKPPLNQAKADLDNFKSQWGEIQNTEFKSTNSVAATYKITSTKRVFLLTIGLNDANKITVFRSLPCQEEKILLVDASLIERPVSLNVPDASLSGSIITPKNSIGKIPVVMIVGGTGSIDRNGNVRYTYGANSYFLLAEALGKAGIATLR